MSELKRGRLSQEETDFIKSHAGTKSAAEIARDLNRSPDTVYEWVKKNALVAAQTVSPAEVEKATIRQELRATMAWKKLKDQFEADELVKFEEQYLALMAQFKEDVMATEEGQIMKAVKYDLLMDRNLVDRRKARQDIARLEKCRDNFFEAKGTSAGTWDMPDREFLLNLEGQINQAKAAEQSKTKEFTDLEAKHQALMRDLKATRDQRISKIESSKVTFLGLLKALQDPNFRQEEGRQAELMKLASDKELKRLAQPHKYDDNNEDLPILSAETLEMLEDAT
jgi:hypothetical protein